MFNRKPDILRGGHQRRRGFTLVELLIVIGIVGLLMGILLPSLCRARQSAMQVVCQTNLRQWGQALLLYAQQNNGWLPRRGQGAQPTGQLDRPTDWFNALPPLMNLQPYTTLAAQVQVPQPAQSSLWICPASTSPARTPLFTYAMNMRLSTWNDALPARLSRVGPLSNLVFMTDGPGPYCSVLPSNQPYSPAAPHQGRVNICFADMHVASFTGAEVRVGIGEINRPDVRWKVPGSTWPGPGGGQKSNWRKKMQHHRFILALCAIIALPAMTMAQLSVGINPTIDAFVDSAQAGNNYGVAGSLGVAPSGAAKGEFDSYIQFNTASVKSSFDSNFGAGNWSIQSATLRLTSTPPNNAIFNGNGAGAGGTNINTAGSFSIDWFTDDSWIEGNGQPSTANTIANAITFNSNLPSTSGAQSLGTFNFPGGTSGNNTYTLTLSAGLLADIIAGSTPNFRLLAADSSINYLFNSKDFTTAASRPLLTITAVPEPGMVLLPFAILLLRRKSPKCHIDVSSQYAC